jgi:hypothetical protein
MPTKSWPSFSRCPLNDDGFFVEKHAKLGPSEFATDGVFLCGMAHYPKSIDEAVSQGKAAASRAVTLLAQETSLPAAKWPRNRSQMCSPAAGYAYPSAPIQHPASSKRMRACLPAGQDQPGAVQGVRPVRGLMPLRGHSSHGIRQQPDFCHRCHFRSTKRRNGRLKAVASGLNEGERYV